METKKNIYVGNRYVPKIMGLWDSSKSYEGLSIVLWEGNSFTSKKTVPENILLSNEDYWVSTGNYNAQIEMYRQEVKKNATDLTSYKNDVTEIFEQKETDFSNYKNDVTTNLDLLKSNSESPNKVSDLVYPIYIPHRGAMGLYQENTMKSYEACVSRGNNIIEMDVQKSKDGSLFVMHDKSINSKTNGKGLVSDLSTGYLQKVKVIDKVGSVAIDTGYSPENIPNVGQVLDRFNKSATYIIESKDNASAVKIALEVSERNLEEYTIIQSFDLNDLKAVENKKITLMYLNNYVALSDHTMLKNMGVVFIGVSTTVSGDYIAGLKNSGFKVVVYTVNHRYIKNKFLSFGVDGIFSDEPFYLNETSPKYTKDSYNEKVYSDGVLPMYGTYKGDFTTINNKQAWGFLKSSSITDGRDFVLQGQFGKLANEFSMNLTLNKLTHLDGAWASIAICLQNDYFDDNKNPSLSAGGYNLLFTANGGLQLYELTPTGADNIAEYAPNFDEWGEGKDIKLKITVSSSTISFERLDIPHKISVNNSLYRSGYVAFGRKNVNFVFSDIEIV